VTRQDERERVVVPGVAVDPQVGGHGRGGRCAPKNGEALVEERANSLNETKRLEIASFAEHQVFVSDEVAAARAERARAVARTSPRDIY
jgi:hypothetical protein